MEHKATCSRSERSYLKALFLLQRKTPYIRPTDLAIRWAIPSPALTSNFYAEEGWVDYKGP